MRLFLGAFIGAVVGDFLDQIVSFIIQTHMNGVVSNIVPTALGMSLFLGLLFAIFFTIAHLFVKVSKVSVMVSGMVFAIWTASTAYQQGAYAPVFENYALTLMLGLFVGLSVAVCVLTVGKAKSTNSN
jgi:hypothetical protein